jgi:hypothetical protein
MAMIARTSIQFTVLRGDSRSMVRGALAWGAVYGFSSIGYFGHSEATYTVQQIA